MPATILTLIAAFVTLTVCITLVFHHDYEDGLIGRLGLVFIAIPSGVRVLDSVDSLLTHANYLYISPMGIMLYCGCALFFGRHLWRFLHLSRKSHWKKAAK